MKTTTLDTVIALLRRILNEMVSHPDDLKVEHRLLTASAIVTMQAHAADTPRLIGESAANYRALVALVTAAGAKVGCRINVPPIKEPVTGEPARYYFEARNDWPRERLLVLLRDVMAACFTHADGIRLEVDDDDASGITTIEAFVSRMEKAETVTVCGAAIWKVFDAIGRTNGRLLVVDVMRDMDPAQPETADGRYAKAKPR